MRFWQIFSGGGIFGTGSVPEARAAQPPSIEELKVTAVADGVSAECRFSDYFPDAGYAVQLYLYEVDGTGTQNEVSCRDVDAADSGSGTAGTEGVNVENGIYMAAAVVKGSAGSGSPFYTYRNSMMYDVVRTGNTYVVSGHQEHIPGAEDKADDDLKTSREEVSGENDWEEKVFSCRHENVDYKKVKEANAEEDALQVGICRDCGAELAYSYVPNTAYAAFLQDAIHCIQSGEGEEVRISTRRWTSFNQAVFDAMAEYPERAVTVDYRYEGKLYAVTIPAGADVGSLTDENGFCGFRYLDQVFGGMELTE